MSSAEELHRRGVAAINAGRVRAARPLLEQALQAASDSDLIARIEASLAYVAADTGNQDEALAICDRALSRQDLSASTRGVVQSQRALLLMRRGETTRALEAFAAAIGSLVDAPADLGKAYLNRGGVYLQQGLATQAQPDFEAAAQELERADLPVESAMARHNLGYCLLLRGDLIGALAEMDEARLLLAPLSPVHEATCDQDRAEVLIAAGLTTEGRTALGNAARAYGMRSLHRRRAEAELTLARTLVHADPREALRHARNAARRFSRVDAPAWCVRSDAVALAAEVELGRKSPALVVKSDELAVELTDQGLQWGAAQVRMHAVRVLIRRGEYDDARTRLGRIRVGSHAPLGVRLLARTTRVELAAAQGRKVAALQHVRTGLAELHAWQSTFGSLDLQTGVVGQGRRLALHGLALATEIGRPEVVFEWSERARMLASRVTPVRPPADQQMASDLAELRRITEASDGIVIPAPRRDAELRQRVRERAWQVRGSGEVSEPAPLEEVRRALGDDTTLVAWVVANDRLVALVVNDEGESVHELGPFPRVRALLTGLLPDLDVAASALPPSLTAVVRAELVDRVAQLAEVVVAPLLDRIGDRRLVVTPSGGLAGTPWTLLPGFVGRPVTVAPSATAWLLQRQRPLHATTAGFVAGPRVARAADEVTAAAARWPGAEVLTDTKASAEGVAALAAEVDVLHVAAHGRHSAENPLFSGVELAGGPWFGYDIDQLPTVPQVVVLSACEVGRSSVRFGEELIGMTAAWLHAGARCVIASPSAVADDAAHDVLTAMHAGLAAGLDPAAALAAAVPAIGPDAPPAPFVCFGAGW